MGLLFFGNYVFLTQQGLQAREDKGGCRHTDARGEILALADVIEDDFCIAITENGGQIERLLAKLALACGHAKIESLRTARGCRRRGCGCGFGGGPS